MAETTAATRENENIPTDEEISWAKNIRSAMKAEDKPKELREAANKMSDFFLLQLAIVSKGKVPKAVKRMNKYLSFKRKYKLDDLSYEESIEWAVNTFPGLVEGTGSRDVHGRVVSCLNYAQWLPAKIQSERDWSLSCKFFLGNMEASVATLAEARNGAVYLAQCDGVGWANFSMEMEQTFAQLYQESYPLKLKSIAMTNGGWLLNTFVSMCKWFLTKKISDRLVTCDESDLVGTDTNTFRYFETIDSLPSMFGGNFAQPYREWVAYRLDKRRLSIESVKLE